MRDVDAPVHYGCYSDGKHIQFVCDKSWNKPKWGDDGDRTTDPEVYVADDDRLYTFNSKKTSCPGCK